MAANKCSNHLVWILIVINITALAIFPIWLSFQVESDFLLGSFVMGYAIAIGFKLVSFHHVMYDVRNLVFRVMEAKKEGKTIDVNELEGTTLGVHQI